MGKNFKLFLLMYLGGVITILRNKNESIVNNSYFAYYFNNGLIKKISRLTQDSTFIHFHWKYFKHVDVKLPSLEEQEKKQICLSVLIKN